MDEKRTDPGDNQLKTRKEFIVRYGGLTEWEKAALVKVEKRVDPADGNWYTKEEFIACYKGTTQWDRAAEEYRIDKSDGKAYTKKDFIICYGGTAEWDKARAVGSKEAEPEPKPEEDLTEPDAVEVPSPTPEQPPVTSEPAPVKPSIPGRKAERKVISLTPEQLKEFTKRQASEKPSPRAPPKAALPRVDSSRSSGPDSRPSPSPVIQKVLRGYSATEGIPDAKLTMVTDKNGLSQMGMVVVGHVDAGKSTLMGHLLCDLEVVSKRMLHKYEKESKAIGKQSFQYAWVLDETEEERERGVTMDVATANFQTPTKQVTLLDAPGHSAFVGNTCNGVTQADMAVIVINAVQGEFEAGLERGQTREHIFILRGSGIKHIIIAVNKIDTVPKSQERFEEIRAKLSTFLDDTGFRKENLTWVPVSGLHGYNLTTKPNDAIPWWEGPTLLEAINQIPQMTRATNLPLRMSISDVAKNAVGGRIETGSLKKGDKVGIQPGGEVGVVKQIERNHTAVDEAFAGDHVELLLTGTDPANVLIGMAVSSLSLPVRVSNIFEAQVMVVSPGVMITKSYKCVVHIQSAVIDATISKMLPLNGKTTRFLTQGKTGLVKFTLSRAIPVEVLSEFKGFGRIVVRSEGLTVAMGAVTKIYIEETQKCLG
eukprot:TRINITY_DN3014_c8_g1_i1.p1 TRINITY_DN3014_c8_g1~~TRINITY_DN3014_c8_g1_i1.p1  ORF type:complete len:660 (+),score=181.51 TRINITY_DN3014_c8_g1_i1:26-1981(+)